MTNIVNSLKSKINKLHAEIHAIENKITVSNTKLLVEEILNLQTGCGNGYTAGDYYAPTRYYSKIPGVKNIRNGNGVDILVKIGTPLGNLLPNTVTVNGEVYKIEIILSRNFCDEINY